MPRVAVPVPGLQEDDENDDDEDAVGVALQWDKVVSEQSAELDLHGSFAKNTSR